MTDTALQVVQNVAAEVGLVRPTTLHSDSDKTGRTVRVLLNRGGRILTRMQGSFGEGWAVLNTEYVFDTVPGQEEYPLPVDFWTFITETLWDRSTFRELRGSLAPSEWQELRSGLIETVSIAPLYRLRKNSLNPAARSIFLDPVPSTTDTLVFEYISTNWVKAPSGVLQDQVTSDADTFLFDDDLIELDVSWRFRKSRGLDFVSELTEFESQRDRRFGVDRGDRKIALTRSSIQRRRSRIPSTIRL